jgi:hypothetical protein
LLFDASSRVFFSDFCKINSKRNSFYMYHHIRI